MATASDLIQETKVHLLGGAREELNTLAAAVSDTTSTTWTLTYDVGSIQKGAVLAVDLELVYVWSVAIASKQVTVQRSHLGSTATTHAIGAMVSVNPRFSDFTIFKALNAEILSYASPRWGLFQMKTVDLTYNAAQNGYDLTSVTDLIDVYSIESTGYTTGDVEPIRNWRLARNQSTAVFASGFGLIFYEGANPGRNIRVVYKAPFVAMTTVADNVANITGLAASAHDIPPLGAASRIISVREARRATLDAQPEPRQASEVPPGTAQGAGSTLMTLRDRRLREEAARLQSRYPALMRAV